MNDFNDMNVVGEPEKSALPLVSMILGIVAAVCAVGLWCCAGYVVGGPLGIAALVIALICKSKGIEQDKGYTLTGLITGIVAIVGALAGLVYWIIWGGMMLASF
ncbi:MAG: hypothetical protein FWF77_00280 [Defluviitaleaceae bacterium]|nr:hypothetical protein [Defluviitaleaceae bacterium]